jgi:hypothetical protein
MAARKTALRREEAGKGLVGLRKVISRSGGKRMKEIKNSPAGGFALSPQAFFGKVTAYV